MPSPADLLARGTIGLVVLLSGCAGPGPVTPTPSVQPRATVTPSASAAPNATPIPTPSGSPEAAAVALPDAGRPWDGAALLREMAASTRPGGVPDELRTPELAAAIAEVVWTVDGTAWDTIAIGGFCGATSCTLDLAGSHLGRAGEDLWTLDVDPAAGRVEPVVAEVRSLPWDLVDALDGLARSLDDDGRLSSMTLTTARWLPPPGDEGRFVLSYRAGGEEGSCARDLLVDAVRGEIVEESESDC